jgi:hypothetical protein
MKRHAAFAKSLMFRRRRQTWPSEARKSLRERLRYPPQLRRVSDQELPQLGRFAQKTCARIVSYGLLLLTMIKIVLIVAISKASVSQ